MGLRKVFQRTTDLKSSELRQICAIYGPNGELLRFIIMLEA